MKKKVTITAVVIICILLVVAVTLSANRAGGEIGFEATINSVENGVAYATINKQDAGFLAPKLPGNIEFNTSDMDVKLQADDEISGCYLSGTINGSSVRVVDVTIKGNASQGINDLISLNEVSDYITEKGYTSKDFEESLMVGLERTLSVLGEHLICCSLELTPTVGILMMIKTEELALPMTEMAMYVKL